MDNYLTKDKVKVILNNAPAGSDQNKIIEALINKGYTLEGLNDTQTEEVEPVVEQQSESVGGLKGFSVGVAKSELELARGTGKLLQGLGQRVMAAPALIPGGKTYKERLGEVKEETGLKMFKPETDVQAAELFKRRGTAEQVGGVTGDIAALAVPLTKVSKIEKGWQIFGKGVQQGFKNLFKRAAIEGVTVGGVTSMREGEIGKEAVDTAIMSSLFPVAGAGLKGVDILTKPARQKLTSSMASKVVNSLIKPLLKDISYGKDPGRAIAKEGIVAKNLDDLVTKINQALKTTYGKVEKIYNRSDIKNKELNISKVFSPLDDALTKARITPKTNVTVIKRLEDTLDDLNNLIAGKDLTKLSPNEILKIKQTVGNITKFTGSPSDDKILNQALKKVYGNLKGTLDDAIPEAGVLNAHYADLKSGLIATIYRDKIVMRHNLVQFTPKIIGGAGAAASLVTMNPAPVLLGLGAAGVEKAMSTPKFKTAFAKWLVSASKEETQQLIQKMPWMKAIIIKTFTDEEQLDILE